MEMPTLRGWAVGVWRRADDRSSSLELTNASFVELVCIASERKEWNGQRGLTNESHAFQTIFLHSSGEKKMRTGCSSGLDLYTLDWFF